MSQGIGTVVVAESADASSGYTSDPIGVMRADMGMAIRVQVNNGNISSIKYVTGVKDDTNDTKWVGTAKDFSPAIGAISTTGEWFSYPVNLDVAPYIRIVVAGTTTDFDLDICLG